MPLDYFGKKNLRKFFEVRKRNCEGGAKKNWKILGGTKIFGFEI